MSMSVTPRQLPELFADFLRNYDVEAKDAVWRQQSNAFRSFWTSKIRNPNSGQLSDSDIDDVVRILDRNGKGNTKTSEAVAKAMIAQGAWRRMFTELKNNSKLSDAVNAVLVSVDATDCARSIDQLYQVNAKHKNNLTGKSGNAICAMMAAWDPRANLSVISLNDRRRLLSHFQFEMPPLDSLTIGNQIVRSNTVILNGFAALGVRGSARTVSVFLYSSDVKPIWKPDDAVVLGGGGNGGGDGGGSGGKGGDEPSDPGLFYLEEELENFLIRNWDQTELGRKYDLIEEDGEMVSQQYATPVGPIDILVQDKKTKQFVVIELKRDQTSDQTVGQLARYMGWLEENKTHGKSTKGIIIAGKYDSRLYYALKVLRDAEVYLYQVDFKLNEFKDTKR